MVNTEIYRHLPYVQTHIQLNIHTHVISTLTWLLDSLTFEQVYEEITWNRRNFMLVDIRIRQKVLN